MNELEIIDMKSASDQIYEALSQLEGVTSHKHRFGGTDTDWVKERLDMYTGIILSIYHSQNKFAMK